MVVICLFFKSSKRFNALLLRSLSFYVFDQILFFQDYLVNHFYLIYLYHFEYKLKIYSYLPYFEIRLNLTNIVFLVHQFFQQLSKFHLLWDLQYPTLEKIYRNFFQILEKLAKTQGNFRMSEAEVTSFLEDRGYLQPLPIKYGQWLGVLPGYVIEGKDGTIRGKCIKPGMKAEDAATFCGVLQGDWGYSTVFKDDIGKLVLIRLSLTGKLMFWVMVLMIPSALIIGILAGMREGSRTDRTLSYILYNNDSHPRICIWSIFIS